MSTITAPKITPFLWFDHQAEEAARYYVSLFAESEVGNVTLGPQGAAMVVSFRLGGREFLAFNGGPHYQLNGAFSLMVHCETQAEVDHYWQRLAEGGSELQCGWLTDRFGLFWQIIPTPFFAMVQDKDSKKVERVMQAMYEMKKMDLPALQRAYDGA